MIHDIFKFSMCQGSATILGTNTRAQYCHQIKAVPELVRAPKKSKEGGSTEEYQINMEYLEQVVQIGAHLSNESRA